MTETAWLWFYVACMAAGALLFFTWSRRPSGVPQFEYAVAMAIPIWSGLAYTSLALGQGTLLVDGREVQVARPARDHLFQQGAQVGRLRRRGRRHGGRRA